MVSRGQRRWLPLIALVVAAFSVGCAIGSGAPPSVSYTTPADGTASFPAGNITAVFNRAMDSTSITSTSFLVYQGTTPIPGTVTASGNTATFVPTTSLPSALCSRQPSRRRPGIFRGAPWRRTTCGPLRRR